MRKKQVDEIIVGQKKKRHAIIGYAIEMFIVIVVAALYVFLLIDGKKIQYVTYNESSTVDYNVFLKENSVFETESLKKGNRYIASLINYIKANFKYDISLDKDDVEYKYSYRVEATLDIKDNDKKGSLYSRTDTLIPQKYVDSNTSEIHINEDVIIDYNKYNDWANNFIKLFELPDTLSTLTVNMYVSVVGSCEDFEESQRQESVMTLTIPLTDKTIGIEISDDLLTTDDQVMLCKSSKDYSLVYLMVLGGLALCELILGINLVRYLNKTRTAESTYDRELKKILNNYKSYIQKINNTFNLDGYQVLKVDSFTDMLEIRDALQQPILMVESARTKGVHFVIPSSTKILYSYSLKLSEIKKQMKDEEK